MPAALLFGGRVNQIIFLVTEPPEGGYAAQALGHSIFTVEDSDVAWHFELSLDDLAEGLFDDR